MMVIEELELDDWSKYPDPHEFKFTKEKALWALLVVKEELGIERMTISEISKFLTEKIEIDTSPQSIRHALKNLPKGCVNNTKGAFKIMQKGRLELGLSRQNGAPVSQNNGEFFVDSSRMLQIESINSDKFDLSRLKAKCEELNTNYQNDGFFSCAMLIRSIIDHIPPIFGKSNFSEVSGSHGTRSFKESMTHLDKSSRKIADAYLHTHLERRSLCQIELKLILVEI